jgi:hypothetical protein
MNTLVWGVNFEVTLGSGRVIISSPDHIYGHLNISGLGELEDQCIDDEILSFSLMSSAWVNALQEGRVIDRGRKKIEIIDLEESIKLMASISDEFIAKLSSNHPSMTAASARNNDIIEKIRENAVKMNELYITNKRKQMVVNKSPQALFLLMNSNRQIDDCNKI